MGMALIHEKGWKGARDREKLISRYALITKFFKVKPVSDLELSRLGNAALFKLSEDVFNRQPISERRRFAERYYAIGNPQYRRNPRRFKWAYIDARKAHGRIKAFFVAISIKRYNRNVAKAAESKAAENTGVIKFPEAEAKA